MTTTIEEKERTNPNAGAKKKPVKEKKTAVQLYVTGQQIEDVGGIDKAREIAKAAIISSGLVKK